MIFNHHEYLLQLYKYFFYLNDAMIRITCILQGNIVVYNANQIKK